MSILVLGGAGYIGSHAVDELIRIGEDVVVADNLQTGHVEALQSKTRFYQGDIRDSEFLDDLFSKEKIDSVIHFAADALVGESMHDPMKYYDNNLHGTMVLLKSMIDNGVEKIVFSSTAAVYGEPDELPITEEHRTEPINPYGETKLAMEKMFKWASNAHNIRYVSLRYFNACGAHKTGKIGEDHKPETHIIPCVLQTALKQRDAVSILGDDYDTKDGSCVRDYIYVTDLAKAHILALDYLNRGNENNIFNLGNGNGFSVIEIIDAAKEVTGCDIPAVIATRRQGDPAILVASSEKAKNILGWKPEYTDLKEIIESAWNWHKNNPNGYDK